MPRETCCPRFDPTALPNRRVEWKDKLFIKGHALAFLHMPLNFGSVMTQLQKKIDDADAATQDGFHLATLDSAWGTDVYVQVTKKIPGEQMYQIDGSFMRKTYSGEYKDFGDWINDFQKWTGELGVKVHPIYAWYTTCPTCAKKYGANYTVLYGKITHTPITNLQPKR